MTLNFKNRGFGVFFLICGCGVDFKSELRQNG